MSVQDPRQPAAAPRFASAVSPEQKPMAFSGVGDVETNTAVLARLVSAWLRTRERDGQTQTVLWAVQSAETC